uniref:RST domain-containing protein n=1 Tax=Chenopodium quinoa TaxID=63459 RepID=A0A803L8M2_CHEQI
MDAEEVQFYYDDDQLSDCESCVSGESNDESNDNNDGSLFGDDVVKLNEDVAVFDIIGHKFLSTLVDYDHEKRSCTTITAIYTMNWKNSRIKRARFQSFDIFRVPKDEHIRRKPETSLWMPFSTLISALSNVLPSYRMDLIIERHNDFKERKISRQEFIGTLKECVGRDFLIKLLKHCGAKVVFSHKKGVRHLKI